LTLETLRGGGSRGGRRGGRGRGRRGGRGVGRQQRRVGEHGQGSTATEGLGVGSQRGGSRAGGRGRGLLRQNLAIVPNECSPPRLRKRVSRLTEGICPACSTVHRHGEEGHPYALWEEYGQPARASLEAAAGRPTRRARVGPSPGRTGDGSPVPVMHSPLGRMNPALERGPYGRPLRRPALQPSGHLAVNLAAAFASASRVDDWLTAVTELAAVEVPALPHESQEQRQNGVSSSVPQPRHTDRIPPSHQVPSNCRTIPCMPGGPNSKCGNMLPDSVWVPLHILGYDSTQWGGLTSFLGDVQQSW
jgi:hypothetical protein